MLPLSFETAIIARIVYPEYYYQGQTGPGTVPKNHFP